jgi:hypothetical protein
VGQEVPLTVLAIFTSIAAQRISSSLSRANNETEGAHMGQNGGSSSGGPQSGKSSTKQLVKVWSAAGLTTLSAVGASIAMDPVVLLS